MRGVLVGVICGVMTPFSFGQSANSDIHYYAYGNLSHNLQIFASSESRVGGGFGLAVGRIDPKLKIRHRTEGELIYEAYYSETSTKDTSAQFPFETCKAFGLLATARYRWKGGPGLNFFGDLGFGVQFIDHPTRDLPLCSNSTFEIGTGAEFRASEKTAFLLGARLLHQSNMGRKRPNFGQNLLQWYVGISVKK